MGESYTFNFFLFSDYCDVSRVFIDSLRLIPDVHNMEIVVIFLFSLWLIILLKNSIVHLKWFNAALSYND